jgi:hypothetical protein
MSLEHEMVLVAKAELEELRKLKEELPAIIEKAKAEGGMDRLKVLNQKNKENPEEHRRKSKERYALKKDQILAKRREAYRLKKETKAQTPGDSSVRAE